MDMELLGYLAAAFIGILLGLIGGGGSILTVPLMVYFFKIDPLLATSYSLFVVGGTSLIGAYQYWTSNSVSLKTVLSFGLSSTVTVYIIRKYINPEIPVHLFTVSGFEVSSSRATMLLFALLMIAASFPMIRKEQPVRQSTANHSGNTIKLLLFGVGIGATTGLLGAGGGFLLIPTLVILAGLPMKEAVGTSLMIISLNSLVGFSGDLGYYTIDWSLLTKVTAIAIAGVFLGVFLSIRVDAEKLRKGFGGFVLVIGGYILLTEILW